MQHKINDIILESIVPTENQTKELFHQLKQRAHSISHRTIPAYEDHYKFVNNNPYRAWFIIKVTNQVIGNIYVHFDNSIGLNCNTSITELQIKSTLKKLYLKLRPLKAKPSVRFGGYFLNVSSSNTDLQNKLIKIGLKESQRSYRFC